MALPTGVAVSKPPAQLSPKVKMYYISYTIIALAIDNYIVYL